MAFIGFHSSRMNISNPVLKSNRSASSVKYSTPGKPQTKPALKLSPEEESLLEHIRETPPKA